MCIHVSELGYTSDARGAMHWAQTKKKGQVRRAPKWHEIPRPRLSPKAGSEGESPPECSAFGASLPLWQSQVAGIGASRSQPPPHGSLQRQAPKGQGPYRVLCLWGSPPVWLSPTGWRRCQIEGGKISKTKMGPSSVSHISCHFQPNSYNNMV